MWSQFSHGWDNFQDNVVSIDNGQQTRIETISVQDIMDQYYEMFRVTENEENKKDFFNSPNIPDHSDQDSDTNGWTQ